MKASDSGVDPKLKQWTDLQGEHASVVMKKTAEWQARSAAFIAFALLHVHSLSGQRALLALLETLPVRVLDACTWWELVVAHDLQTKHSFENDVLRFPVDLRRAWIGHGLIVKTITQHMREHRAITDVFQVALYVARQRLCPPNSRLPN